MVACFCHSKGYSDIYNVVVGKKILYKYKEPSGKVLHLPICSKFKEAAQDSVLYGKLICTKTIVVLNIIIRFAIIYAIKKVGYKTNADMYMSIFRSVFLA